MGRYTPPLRLVNAIAYGVPLAVVAAGWLIRRELARRELARRELARRELARRELARRAGGAGLPPLADAPAVSAATEAMPPETAPAGNWFTRSPAAETVPAEAVPAETVAAETVPAEFMDAGFTPTGSTADASREVPV